MLPVQRRSARAMMVAMRPCLVGKRAWCQTGTLDGYRRRPLDSARVRGVYAAITVQVVLLGCALHGRRTPERGTIVDHHYVNQSYGLAMDVPSSWSVASDEA